MLTSNRNRSKKKPKNVTTLQGERRALPPLAARGRPPTAQLSCARCVVNTEGKCVAGAGGSVYPPLLSLSFSVISALLDLLHGDGLPAFGYYLACAPPREALLRQQPALIDFRKVKRAQRSSPSGSINFRGRLARSRRERGERREKEIHTIKPRRRRVMGAPLTHTLG